MSDPTSEIGAEDEGAVVLPIDGVLDLHAFHPSDARDVVGDYLDACREEGVLDVRIIHGKGQGTLRTIVHSLLQKRADVVSFGLATDAGGWGATRVRLAQRDEPEEASLPEGGGEAPAQGADGCASSPISTLADTRVRSLVGIVPMLCAALLAGCSPSADEERDVAEPLQLSEGDGGPEVTSLMGVPLFRPLLSDERRARLEANLDEARAEYEADPESEGAIVWYGRRLAYLSRYQDAIAVYSRGLELHPDSYTLLRHRGHRYISTRQLDAAVADFVRAAELAEAEPVEIEPDGAPNARNIPLSNIHFNIWYHLGLAYYLQGNFEAARDAYLRCMEYSDNNDLRVATSDWLYMTYRRLGDEEGAASVLEGISADMEIIENDAYHRRLLMYKGEIAPEELLDLRADMDPDVALSIATQGYGVGNWYLVNGDAEAARGVFERILEGTSWAAFGYIAAEAEIARDVGR